MALVVGIDWATKKKNRALVVLDVAEDGGSVVERVVPNVSDADVIDVCRNRGHAVVAVDTPFGWPRDFSAFVATWRPAGRSPSPPSSERFRLRSTDRIVKTEVQKQPLSVSSDRIALGARCWTNVLATEEMWSHVDVLGRLGDEPPTLIEVYPGATAVMLGKGLARQPDELSYKSDAETRRRLLSHIAAVTNANLGHHEDEIVSEDADSDKTDAFLAALTAAIYVTDRSGRVARGGWRVRRPQSPEETDLASIEGWIFFPMPAEP